MRRSILIFSLLLSLAVQAWALGPEYGPIATDKPFYNSKFIDINGTMLHYRIWPAATSGDSLPWIFMVHGFASSTWAWEKSAPALAAEGWNVIAVDVPPFGYSSKGPGLDHSPDSRAELMWDFLNRVKPGKQWNLVGHSMGGGIVQTMAILHPELVNKVVFVDPALNGFPAGKSQSGPVALRFKPLQWIAAGVGKLLLVHPGQIKKLLRSAYAAEPDPIDISEYYKAMNRPGFALGVIRMSAGPKARGVDGLKFDKPALAIWGSRDSWVPLGRMEPLLNRLQSVNVRVIPGAGHCPMATHASLFNSYLLEFLR